MPDSGLNQGLALGTILFIVLACFAIYLFYCFCLKVICEKAGHDPGILIWIPILQILPLFNVAGMNPLWILGLFIPVVNLVVTIILWVKVCEARGKSPLLVIMMFIPCLNLFFLPYLAFSE